MSKFYGTVRDGWRGNTPATRCGHLGITTTAQSYDGSVITELMYDKDNKLNVIVAINPKDSSTRGDTLFDGTLDELYKLLKRHADYKNRKWRKEHNIE